MTPKCKAYTPALRYKRVVIRSLRHDHQTLDIDIQGEGFAFLRVTFRRPVGYRVLDERDLCEFWTDYHEGNGWLYEVESGGWLELESTRPMFNTPSFHPTVREYFLVCDMCISVLSNHPPELEDLGTDPTQQ